MESEKFDTEEEISMDIVECTAILLQRIDDIERSDDDPLLTLENQQLAVSTEPISTTKTKPAPLNIDNNNIPSLNIDNSNIPSLNIDNCNIPSLNIDNSNIPSTSCSIAATEPSFEEFQAALNADTSSQFSDRSSILDDSSNDRLFTSFGNNNHSTTENNSGKRKRYSRRRYSRYVPMFENNYMYGAYHCSNPRAVGAQFCIQHLRESPSPLYTRCAYTEPKSGKRCKMYSLRSPDSAVTLCQGHSTSYGLSRLRESQVAGPEESVDSLLSKIKNNISYLESTAVEDNNMPTSRKPLDDYEQNPRFKDDDHSTDNEIIEEDDVTDLKVLDPDSDAEEANLAKRDCLRNSAFYATDEVLLMYDTKNTQLRNFYEKVARHHKLQYKWNKLEYAAAVKRFGETEMVTTDPYVLLPRSNVSWRYIQDQMKEKKRTIRMLKKDQLSANKLRLRQRALTCRQELAATKSIESNPVEESSESDTELVDWHKLLQEENSSKESVIRQPMNTMPTICSYSFCKKRALTCNKFCPLHILEDKDQKLMKACGRQVSSDGSTCNIPVLRKIQKKGCDLHVLPVLTQDGLTVKKRITEKDKNLPLADRDEAETIIQNLIADKVTGPQHLEEAIRNLEEAGLDKEDTSDSELDEEEDNVPENFGLC